jgi:hypothetical protein
MGEVELTFGVPDGIASEVKKKYKDEKSDLRVTRPSPAFAPYYAVGDPRAKYDIVKFEGKDYWVYRVGKV